MGDPQNPHFCDFGTFERVLSSQKPIILYLATPGHLKKIKKNSMEQFRNTIVVNFENVGIQMLAISKKTGAEKG